MNPTNQYDNNDKQFEQLSALMDGQLPIEEANALIDDLLKDEQLQAKWQQMHVISQVAQAQGKAEKTPLIDVSQAVSQAIDKEPAHYVEHAVDLIEVDTNTTADSSAKQSNDWHNRSILFKSGVGLAVAASVMFVTLNISTLLTSDSPTSTAEMTSTTSETQLPVKTEQTPTHSSQSQPLSSTIANAPSFPRDLATPVAQTATFSQSDAELTQGASSSKPTSQAVSGRAVINGENKKRYPFSKDEVDDGLIMNKEEIKK